MAAGPASPRPRSFLPWLSSEKTLDAYAAMDRRAFASAAERARSAHSLNSLAVEPLYALGEAETFRGVTSRPKAGTPGPSASSPTTRTHGSTSATSSCRPVRQEDRLRLPQAGDRLDPFDRRRGADANRGLHP